MAKILVIDDDNLTRALIAKTLRAAGHEIDDAANGEQGIQHLKSNRYDLVVTDIVMPNRSGISVAEYIRKNDPATAILVVSAFSGREPDDGVLEFADHFADEALCKPFEKDELLEAVESLLQTTEAKRGRHS